MGAFSLRDAAGGSALRDGDTLREAAAGSSATIGQAVDTSTARTLTARSTTTLGQASHTNTALAVSAGGPVLIGQASESDTALAVTGTGGAAVGGLENSPLTGRYAYSYPLQVVVGDQDLTRHVQNASWSSVDPGGFEMCQVSLSNPVKAPRAGERITVRYGLEVAWQGRVNDPGNANSGKTRVEAISGVGYGACLKDRTTRQIYRDVDLGRWTNSPSTQRLINLNAASIDMDSASVVPDTTGPSLLTRITGAFARSHRSEGNYSARGLAIGSIYYAWTAAANVSKSGTDANYVWQIFTDDADTYPSSTGTGDLQPAGTGAAGTGSGTHTPGANETFAAAQFGYTAAGGNNGEHYDLHWTTLAVYGTHGLTKRGAEPNAGFYPTDIAAHALATYNAIGGVQRVELGPVDSDSTLYACPHATYLEAVPFEAIIDDMLRKQLGWHWGVWEPAGMHSETPRLFMTRPPEGATAHVARRELGDDFDAPRVRLDQLYDRAVVQYTDAAGTPIEAVASIDNPLLSQTGIARTLVVNAGRSTAAAASAYGTFALNLAAAAARGAGSATLPDAVGTPSGRKPACLLKAGRDRLRITDMPDPGPLHETDTRRYDTFHVRRVETSVGPDGVPKTRVELGSGADLMEVLNARAAAATVGRT